MLTCVHTKNVFSPYSCLAQKLKGSFRRQIFNVSVCASVMCVCVSMRAVYVCVCDDAYSMFYEKGLQAFVSFVQSYQKHECNRIFRFKGTKRIITEVEISQLQSQHKQCVMIM